MILNSKWKTIVCSNWNFMGFQNSLNEWTKKKKKKKLNKQSEGLKLQHNHMTESFMEQRFLLPQ